MVATQKITELKKAQESNASGTANNAMAADQDKVYKANAAEAKRAADAAERAWEDSYKKAVAALQGTEKEKVDATTSGSRARLSAIDDAIKEEQSKGLQETGYYKSLLLERIKEVTKEAEEEQRIKHSMAELELRDQIVTAQLGLRAEEEAAKHRFAMGQSSRLQELAAQIKGVADGNKIEIDALNQRIATLDKSDKDYLVKLKEFEDKKKEIEQQGAQEIKALHDKEAEDVHKAEQKMRDEFAKTAAQSIVEGKNVLQAFRQVGSQMLEAVIANMLEQNLLQDEQQLKDAGHAAASTYAHVMETVPPPYAFPLAIAEAAAAFVGVMSFESGGEVPGSGPVPIMAHGGETVVTKALSDQVKSGGGGHGDVHIHTAINAVDSAGFEGLLHKHAAIVSKHVRSELRRSNARHT